MPEAGAILLVLGLVAFIFIGSLLGWIAFFMARRNRDATDVHGRAIRRLEDDAWRTGGAVPSSLKAAPPQTAPSAAMPPEPAAARPVAVPAAEAKPAVAPSPPAPAPPAPAAPTAAEAPRVAPPSVPPKVVEYVQRNVQLERASTAPPHVPPSASSEPPPSSPLFSWADFEKRVGMRWIAWAGALALIFATGFFVKYAFDNRWIGDTAKVAFGIAFGIILLIVGDQAIRRRMLPLGQALMGAGLAALYVSLFGACNWYKIMPREICFASMAVVTAAGMALAVLHNAIAISILAILGGFLTPVLLSTGVDARDALFTYIMLLDLGVLGVAIFRKWRPLELLAFIGTCLLYAGWHMKFYKPAALVPAMYWLGGFYLVFLVMPFVYHLRARSAVAVGHFVIALLNAVFTARYAYTMLYPDYQHLLGFVALAASAVYLVFGMVVTKRIPDDRVSLFGFIALSVTLLTLAVPLELGLNGILLAWAVEGPALLYLGYRFGYRPVRVGAAIILVVAFLRLFLGNWPSHDALFVLFWNVKFGTALAVPLAAGVFAAIHHMWKKDSFPWEIPLKIAAAVAGGLVATYLIDTELGRWFFLRAGAPEVSRDLAVVVCSTVLVWSAGAAAFLSGSVLWRCRTAFVLAMLCLVVTFLNSADLYQERVLKNYMLFLNLRFLSCLAAVAVCFACAYFSSRLAAAMWSGTGALGAALYYVAGWFLFALLSIEPYSYCLATIVNPPDASRMAATSLQLVWAAFALGALLIGFATRSRAVRVAAFLSLLLAMARLLWHNWPEHSMLFVPVANIRFALAFAVPLAAAVFALIHGGRRSSAQNGDRVATVAAAILAGLLAAFVLNVELYSWLDFRAQALSTSRQYLPLSVTVLIWATCSAALVASGIAARSRSAVVVGVVVLLVPFLTFFRLYDSRMVERFLPLANVRFIVCLIAFVELFFFAHFVRRAGASIWPESATMSKALYWAGGLVLIMLLSVEPYQYAVWTIENAQKAAWAAQMSLTVVWSVYAVVALAIGFWKRLRPLRFAALFLFALTAAKVLLIDMANVRQIYRIISLFGVGILMILAAYLYHRAEKRFADIFGESK